MIRPVPGSSPEEVCVVCARGTYSPNVRCPCPPVSPDVRQESPSFLWNHLPGPGTTQKYPPLSPAALSRTHNPMERKPHAIMPDLLDTGLSLRPAPSRPSGGATACALEVTLFGHGTHTCSHSFFVTWDAHDTHNRAGPRAQTDMPTKVDLLTPSLQYGDDGPGSANKAWHRITPCGCGKGRVAKPRQVVQQRPGTAHHLHPPWSGSPLLRYRGC